MQKEKRACKNSAAEPGRSHIDEREESAPGAVKKSKRATDGQNRQTNCEVADTEKTMCKVDAQWH
ncbi:MAG: hypothetical protein AAGK25_06940 [Pseudomonadota bacterium]